MKLAVELASGGLMYMPGFMMIGSGIQVILWLLPQQFERYWYYWWHGFLKHGIKIASGSMI
jgi:hypothetical protein